MRTQTKESAEQILVNSLSNIETVYPFLNGTRDLKEIAALLTKNYLYTEDSALGLLKILLANKDVFT
jgi:hypothetical protein